MRSVALVALVALAACGSSRSPSQSDRAVSATSARRVGDGAHLYFPSLALPLSDVRLPAGVTISYDTAATPRQISAGVARVASYVWIWTPLARPDLPPLTVSVVARGRLIDYAGAVGGCRVLGTGCVWLTYEPDGSVGGTEWEIPLEEQDVPDPPKAWAAPRDGGGPIFMPFTFDGKLFSGSIQPL